MISNVPSLETLYSTRQTLPAAAHPPKLGEKDLGQTTHVRAVLAVKADLSGQTTVSAAHHTSVLHGRNVHKEPVTNSMPAFGAKRAGDGIKDSVV